ncbi:MAG: magnesium-translocating P-type ATPase [Sandaracinus sp.]
MAKLEHAWAQTREALLAALASRDEGLTGVEAAARRRADGPNSLEITRRRPWLDALLEQLRNPMSWLLVFAAVVSSLAGELTDAVVIVAVIVLSGILDALQQHRASRAIEALRARIALRCDVLRDGQSASVLAEDVVVGDVILLSAGSLVPADGVVLAAKDLQVSEAILTGETFPVLKAPGTSAVDAPLGKRGNALFLGTSVRSGTGTMLVTALAKDTEYGRIAKTLSLRAPETDFDRGIRRFGYLLTRIMVALVVFTFAATVLTHQPPIDSLLFAIALAVGLAPEMLPAIVTVNLSRGARRMAERGVVVRRLTAIEGFGSMDVLCTDKTGTLTRGEIALGDALDVEGAHGTRVLELGYVNAALETGLASPMDAAIRARGEHDGLDVKAWEKLDELPYDFSRKRLGIVARDPSGVRRLVEKGALATVLDVSSHARTASGVVALDDALRERVLAKGRELGGRGMRTLGVASAEVTERARYGVEDEADLVFEGLLTFADPPKDGVAEVVRDLARLGVAVKMISGDAREVANHVASEVGIATDRVLTGKELAAMRDEALWNLAPKTAIFAEVDPNQKERIILALGKSGHVVGYMGDGINDAPALHAADVSLSVDGAVDVAREAADFVLLKQDLGVLRDGVLEGRTTFANTMKYIYTTESANFGNMISMAAAAAFLPFLPLLAIQVLLNNFLSDIPAIAIAGDAVDPELVEAPQRWDLKGLARFMISFGLVSTFFDLLTFAGLYFVLGAREAEFRTGWFVESILTELAVALVVRTRRAAWKSRPAAGLLWSSVAVAVISIVLPYTPLAAVFALVPPPPAMVLMIATITAAYVFAAERWKRIFFGRMARR